MILVRQERWYILGGFALFVLIEVVARLLGVR